MEFLSTSGIAQEIGVNSTELFKYLESLGWITNQNNKKILTDIGIRKGGQIKTSTKFGEYIVWPDKLLTEIVQTSQNKNLLVNSTNIGKHFNTSSQRINLLLNELGWIEKTIDGWRITKSGQKLGGKQLEHDRSGAAYVLWPDTIFQNRDLIETFQQTPMIDRQKVIVQSVYEANDSVSSDFRKKYKAEYRSKDGHYVRSKAELTIDDSLYLWGVAHAYEKKVPNTDKDIYCDFHLPSGHARPKAIYIEYWGIENDEAYNRRKNAKIEIYNELELNLIQLTDGDIKNIDDMLPKYLLKYGIKISV